MIVAEAPATPRSVVIAPPRQWNPAGSLATALLSESDDAPWLRPASVSSLITANSQAGQVPRVRPPAAKVGPGELHRSLLRKVKGLEANIRLQASMFSQSPSTYLAGAVAAVESAAWRGHPHQAKALLASVSAYLSAQERQVRIIDTGQDTLTGKSGPVPVSINNRLNRKVTVLLRARAPSSRMTIHPPVTRVTIPPHQQRTVVIKVRSAVAGLDGAQAEPGRAERGAAARDSGQADRGFHPFRHHRPGHRVRRHRGLRGHRDRPGDPPRRGQRGPVVPTSESRPRSGRERCGSHRIARRTGYRRLRACP